MDYIHPAICSESQFRSMWAEFEWENKVAVHTNITDVREYLRHIMKSTNMSCLTPSAMVEVSIFSLFFEEYVVLILLLLLFFLLFQKYSHGGLNRTIVAS